jgi:hypothetical protein
MTNNREMESLLRMAGRATAMAHAASDPWLKSQWQEIARAYKDVAQSRVQASPSPGRLRVPDPVERGQDNG